MNCAHALALAAVLGALGAPAGTHAGLRLVLGGDIILEGGADAHAALAPLVPLWADADLVAVNLEGPLAPALPRAPGADARIPRFDGRPESAAALAAAGVDIVFLANNHILDAGPGGLAATHEALAAAGVFSVGAHAPDPFAPLVVTRGGHRIVFFAASDRLPAVPQAWRADVAARPARALRALLPGRVAAARQDDRAAFIVVSLHWGREYAPAPTTTQRALARALAAAGADLVVGHHAHVHLPVEREGGAWVLYDTGTLIDARPVPRKAERGVYVVHLTTRASASGLAVERVERRPVR